MKSRFISFLSFLKKKKLPTKDQLVDLHDAPFSVFKGAIIAVGIVSIGLFLSLLMHTSDLLSTEVPSRGGSITEGVIGAPRFINPLLASSETDQTLSSLIFGSLMKESPDRTLVPSLATRCTMAPDGKSYQCVLSENLSFSDKSSLTTSDVVFTFETKKAIALSRDPQSDWANISVKAPDPRTVTIETVGTARALEEKLTLGIVPKALWEAIPIASLEDSALNMAPVGAGAFVVNRISYTNTVPTDVFLKPNPHFVGTRPYLRTLVIHSSANQLDLKDDLQTGSVTSTSALRGTFIDEKIKNTFFIQTIPTEKSVTLFVNQNLVGTPVAQTVAYDGVLIDRKVIIDTIENGYGTPLYLENPPRSKPVLLKNTGSSIPISIAVQKDDDLIATADLFSTALADLGIPSTVTVFDQGTYTDQLQARSYSYILASTTGAIAGYQRLIPLYTKALVHINTNDIHAPTPPQVLSLHECMINATAWYARTDKVWKWFIQ